MSRHKHARKNRPGFTLIELMVVVIIVGVLAAAAVPMYQNSVRQAIRAEAVATLGTIREAQRVYSIPYGQYYGGAGAETEGAVFLAALDIDVYDDSFFGPECYSIATAEEGGRVTGFLTVVEAVADNSAARAQMVLRRWGTDGFIAAMDHRGTLYEADPGNGWGD